MNMTEKIINRINNSNKIIRLLFLSFGAFIFALPFMIEELWILGWFGLSFLFVAIFDYQKQLKRVFGSLFCYFFVFYVFAYSWFVSLYPLDFAGLGTAESIGVIICAELLIPLIHGTMMTLCVFFGYVASTKTANTYFKALLLSCGYVLGEFLQSLGTFAFPWTMLFVGQTDRIEVLQSANLFGARFITLVMVFVNVMIAFAVCGKERKKKNIYICVALAVMMFNMGYGAVRIGAADYEDNQKITALALQGNIPSSEKWREDTRPATEIYYELAQKADEYCENKGINVDVVAIPETAFPSRIYPENPVNSSAKTAFAMAKMLDAEVFVGSFSVENEDIYNSIFLFSPGDTVSQEPYKKRNLVPFGEFMPYRNILTAIVPSLGEINMLSSDLSKGDSVKPLESSVGKAACLVCFDSIFPENARLQVNNGADYIVISTNDSWYKQSGALYQHSGHALMRAIENNVPVVRSANTGISMIIDPLGRIMDKTNVDERDFVVEQVPITKQKTLYTLTGDLIWPLSLIAVFGVIICCFVKKKILPH